MFSFIMKSNKVFSFVGEFSFVLFLSAYNNILRKFMDIQLITMVGFAYFIEDRWRIEGNNYLHGYKHDNKCSSLFMFVVTANEKYSILMIGGMEFQANGKAIPKPYTHIHFYQHYWTLKLFVIWANSNVNIILELCSLNLHEHRQKQYAQHQKQSFIDESKINPMLCIATSAYRFFE